MFLGFGSFHIRPFFFVFLLFMHHGVGHFYLTGNIFIIIKSFRMGLWIIISIYITKFFGSHKSFISLVGRSVFHWSVRFLYLVEVGDYVFGFRYPNHR